MTTYDQTNGVSPNRPTAVIAEHSEIQQDELHYRQLQPSVSESDQQHIAQWNTTQHPYPTDLCVPELVARWAASTPNALAVSGGNTIISYRELNRRANQLAHHLQALGVGPEVPVNLCVERSAEMVVGQLAILKAGGAYVPLDPTYPPDRLAFVLRDTQAPVLVTQSSLAARLPEIGARIVQFDVDAPQLALQSDADPAPSAMANNLAYIIYTSGSTGQPKGVQITHRSLLNLVYWHRHTFAVTPADRATQLASPGFDAVVWEIWPYLTAGASLYLPDDVLRVAPLLLRDWLVATGITISFLPTPLAESMLTLAWPANTELRILLTGADTLYHHPPAGLPFTLVNNYGPTECTVVATSGPVYAQNTADVPPSIGRPIANTQVYLLDEHLRPVPIDMPGELYIGGDGLAHGYVNRPDLTAEKFIPHPFSDEPGARLYRTGDMARFLPDGQIAFLGRRDTQIKMRGYRIEPAEIVAVLNRQPGIRSSAVIAREDTPGDAHLVAYVVQAADGRVTPTALRDAIAACLPSYMMPAAFVVMDALPVSHNGKVDLASLPEPTPANMLRDAPADAPMTPIEERVTGLVAGLLLQEHVGLDDNFFYLGGHSLLGAQLIARLADAFGVEISLRALFDGPTVRELSAEIERLLIAKLEVMSDDEVQRELAHDASQRLLP